MFSNETFRWFFVDRVRLGLWYSTVYPDTAFWLLNPSLGLLQASPLVESGAGISWEAYPSFTPTLILILTLTRNLWLHVCLSQPLPNQIWHPVNTLSFREKRRRRTVCRAARNGNGSTYLNLTLALTLALQPRPRFQRPTHLGWDAAYSVVSGVSDVHVPISIHGNILLDCGRVQ